MKKVLTWGIPAVLVIGLVGWRFMNRGQQAGAAAGGKGRGAAPVEVAVAGPKTIVNSLQAAASVESPFKVEIAPKSAGRIEFLQAREGDPVTVGQVLLKIDPSDLQGAVVQQEAAVAEARSRLAQAKMTQGATDVGVASQIKQERAGVASANADLSQVQRNYDSQVAAAQALVTDAQAKVRSAESQVQNAAAQVEQAKSNLRNAQTKYDRILSMFKQGFVAAQDVDDARTAVDVAQSAVGIAQSQQSAANSGVNSANAQLNSQKQNLEIVKRKGIADIAASKAKSVQAGASLDVATANRSQSPAFRENIAALQSAVAAAQAQLSQARSKLADTVLKSPIQGTVTKRSGDPGALASPSSPVLEVQFLDWLFVSASLPIENAASVARGQRARISFDALPNRVFTGSITNVNAAADPASRQFSVRIKLDNKDHLLRPGMFGTMTVDTSTTQAAVVVPKEAVKTSEKGSTVTIVDKESVAHVQTVVTGATNDADVAIVSGVQAGDKVIVLTYAPVRDGQKVTLGKPGGQKAGGAKRRKPQ